jgi:hypothetical protein
MRITQRDKSFKSSSGLDRNASKDTLPPLCDLRGNLAFSWLIILSVNSVPSVVRNADYSFSFNNSTFRNSTGWLSDCNEIVPPVRIFPCFSASFLA